MTAPRIPTAVLPSTGALRSLRRAQALCEAAPAREWTFVATASDPQGIDSLSATGAVEVYSGDIWVSAHTLLPGHGVAAVPRERVDRGSRGPLHLGLD